MVEVHSCLLTNLTLTILVCMMHQEIYVLMHASDADCYSEPTRSLLVYQLVFY